MSKRSAAAAHAAHAASKKNSAVELTAGDEERARQALQVTFPHPLHGWYLNCLLWILLSFVHRVFLLCSNWTYWWAQDSRRPAVVGTRMSL